MEQVERTWEQDFVGKRYVSLSNNIMGQKIPSDLSSKLTHQITQISVFFEFVSSQPSTLERFKLPARAVSKIAMIAKRIVVHNQINVPR